MIDVFAWMAFFNTKDVGPIVFDIPPMSRRSRPHSGGIPRRYDGRSGHTRLELHRAALPPAHGNPQRHLENFGRRAGDGSGSNQMSCSDGRNRLTNPQWYEKAKAS